MDKSPDAFRTISEVAESLDTPAHVLRFWESRFPQIKPVKRAGGRRYYRPADIALLTGIKRLLHDQGLTIRGVQKILRDQGARHVAGLSDDSVGIDTVLASEVEDDLSQSGVPEAGFIAVEDDPEPDAPPPRQAPTFASQPSLFDADFSAPPALARTEVAKPLPKKPSLPDNVTFSSLIRQLPRNASMRNPESLAAVLRRLSDLRSRMAERAEGGIG